MNFDESLDYLYSQLPMFQKVGKTAYKVDLKNTWALLEILDNPQKEFKSVHVAGTNGKGSSSSMMAAVLTSAGYKTGLYTSPHLKRFTERIRIDGDEISEKAVGDFVEMIKEEASRIKPSFFEMTVAMAFWYFKEQEIDIAIIETGLGGRLDSTNVILPEVSLITNISMDHMDILGDTLAQIAYEKAGIIKEGVPVVLGAHQPELLPVFEDRADDLKAPLIKNRSSYYWEEIGTTMEKKTINLFVDNRQIYSKLIISNSANYVNENLPGVLETLKILILKGFSVSEKHIRQGLSSFQLKGRMQVLRQNPLMIADISHNPAGVASLMGQIKMQSFQSLRIVFGMVKEKSAATIFKLLPQEAIYYFTQSQVPRAMPVEDLLTMAHIHKLSGKSYDTVGEAMAETLIDAEKNDLILICGSTFVVAEIENL